MKALVHSLDSMTADDTLLVDRARGGDEGAFESLYHRHVGRVHGLCLRMSRDGELASELTQRAFIRAWQKLDAFEGRSAFGTWLHRLATNTALDEIRRLGRERSKQVDELPEIAGPRAPEGLSLDLQAAISSLPERARQVFLLYEIEGLRHTEIAEHLGITDGTSKGQLHRARRLLRENLK